MRNDFVDRARINLIAAKNSGKETDTFLINLLWSEHFLDQTHRLGVPYEEIEATRRIYAEIVYAWQIVYKTRAIPLPASPHLRPKVKEAVERARDYIYHEMKRRPPDQREWAKNNDQGLQGQKRKVQTMRRREWVEKHVHRKEDCIRALAVPEKILAKDELLARLSPRVKAEGLQPPTMRRTGVHKCRDGGSAFTPMPSGDGIDWTRASKRAAKTRC